MLHNAGVLALEDKRLDSIRGSVGVRGARDGLFVRSLEVEEEPGHNHCGQTDRQHQTRVVSDIPGMVNVIYKFVTHGFVKRVT